MSEHEKNAITAARRRADARAIPGQFTARTDAAGVISVRAAPCSSSYADGCDARGPRRERSGEGLVMLAPLFLRVSSEVRRMRLGLSEDEREELASRTLLVLAERRKKGTTPFNSMPRDMPGCWPLTEDEELGEGRDHGIAASVEAWHIVFVRFARGIARKVALKIRTERCDALPEDDRLADHRAKDEDDLIAIVDARRDIRAAWWAAFQAWVVDGDPRDGQPARRARAFAAAMKVCPHGFSPPTMLTPETVASSFREAWQRLRAREIKRVRRSVPVRADPLRMAS